MYFCNKNGETSYRNGKYENNSAEKSEVWVQRHLLSPKWQAAYSQHNSWGHDNDHTST
jgi:hypothetical protein